MSTPDEEVPTDDFGNPLTECTVCGVVTQCAAGRCFWCTLDDTPVEQEGGE